VLLLWWPMLGLMLGLGVAKAPAETAAVVRDAAA
jgi:hypothetical protein